MQQLTISYQAWKTWVGVGHNGLDYSESSILSVQQIISELLVAAPSLLAPLQLIDMSTEASVYIIQALTIAVVHSQAIIFVGSRASI